MAASARLWLALFVLAAVTAAGAIAREAAQLPVESMSLEVNDARVEDTSDAGLDDAIAAAEGTPTEPLWVAYAIDGVERNGSLCCGHGSCCDVEQTYDGLRIDSAPGSGPVFILLRFADGTLDRIRTVSEECTVGFGGRRVLWAGAVATRTSIELLDRWVRSDRRKLSHGALAAIAYHDDAEATVRLEALGRSDAADRLAEDAIFWLGAARGDGGFAALQRLLADDLAIGRHKAAVFGLAQSPTGDATDELERLSRTDPREEIRREALFWLGQTRADSAADAIYRAALEDVSLEVAAHAVFVLSQLPEPQSVELLARLLTQRERPEVRKSALFWIGQVDSDDALAIVARILNE